MYRTPVSSRLHIGIFGRRNVGKSSLINAISSQDIAIVSCVAGTTTDPVRKSMEILPIGPCVLIDTAGIDDDGLLGSKRADKSLTVLRKTDIGLIVVDPVLGLSKFERGLAASFAERKLSFLFVINKCDKYSPEAVKKQLAGSKYNYVEVSSLSRSGIEELKNEIIEIAPANWAPVPLLGDIIKPNDVVVLVCPVDSAMPQGRLILPQVQVLREILDSDATAYVAKDTELKSLLESLKNPPNLVITDSQVFETVAEIVPKNVPLTSFSIIFARHKGDLPLLIDGVKAIDTLKKDDELLIAECCTHHAQPEDIGRSKIPTMLINHKGFDLNFNVVAGGEFPSDLKPYKCVIMCGGCMVNRLEYLHRINSAVKQTVAITNYGVLMAYLAGILSRVLEPFKDGVVNIS
ncbi:MAG: [FeFe] hydrogenase H-cluster maturation GTPase HydF [Candidatus Omnitrophota bacterium]